MSATVVFNVGGTYFTTIKETLLKEASSRLALITKNSTPCVRDSTGAYFLDRDPKYFQLILNFLRDGWCLLPSSLEQRRELLQELRYYQLTGFEGWIRTQETIDGGLVSEAPPTLNLAPPSRMFPSSNQDGNAPNTAPTTTMPRSFPTMSTASPNLDGGSFRGPSINAGKDAGPAPPPPPLNGGMSGVVASLREAFLKATSLRGPNQTTAAYSLPVGSEDGGGWTSRYLHGESNAALREMINTLLELAFVPPHRSLHSGKSHISIYSPCDHLSASSLLNNTQQSFSLRQESSATALGGNYASSTGRGGPLGERSEASLGGEASKYSALGGAAAYVPGMTTLFGSTSRNKTLDVEVHGSSGWKFNFTIRPTSDAALWDKYDIAAGVQDNWFVMGAILKDQFGIMLEEEPALFFGSNKGRPDCQACRRATLSVTLTKMY